MSILFQQSDDDEEQEEEEFDQEDDGTSVETKFLQIVQRMQLSHLETAALRLAIARNDASVREVCIFVYLVCILALVCYCRVD